MKSQLDPVNTCPTIDQTNSWVSVSSSTYEECKIQLMAVSQNINIHGFEFFPKIFFQSESLNWSKRKYFTD